MIGYAASTVIKALTTSMKEIFEAWVRVKALNAAVAYARMEVAAGEPSEDLTSTLNRAEYLEDYIKTGKRSNQS
jgi:hypothetical protein